MKSQGCVVCLAVGRRIRYSNRHKTNFVIFVCRHCNVPLCVILNLDLVFQVAYHGGLHLLDFIYIYIYKLLLFGGGGGGGGDLAYQIYNV